MKKIMNKNKTKGTELEEVRKYLKFFRYYLMYKQKYNIEIPATVCGNEGVFDLVSVKLKDLFLSEKEQMCPISEHTYFKAINEQNYSIYEALIPEDNNKQWYSLNDFLELYENIKKEGYQLNKSIIVIDDKNYVIDGWHRASILMSLYGENYEIKAIQINPEKDVGIRYSKFEKLFSIKNHPDKKHKVVTILGIKMNFARKNANEAINTQEV